MEVANVGPDGDWHARSGDSVARALGVTLGEGLSAAEVQARQARVGRNALAVTAGVAWPRILARQFASALVWILLAAAGISAAFGEVTDALTILAIVALNAVLGFVQEYRADRAVRALQAMLSPQCTVLRGGHVQTVPADTLVPGDVVYLEVGDRVPADVRLVETLHLQVDESALTGESEPVLKGIDAVDVATPLAERVDMAFTATAVTRGSGTGLVVATGMQTEVGRIADLTQQVGDETTPLQRRFEVLGRQLGLLAVGIAMAVALVGWLTGRPAWEMMLTAIALAVAVVPEGLPAVVTITLVLGIRSMLARKALLRRLPAAETLGAATVICSDKTGTLTRNEMTVQRVLVGDDDLHVTGSGYVPHGRFERDGHLIDPDAHADLLRLLEAGVRCNHARIDETESGWQQIGEPTEAALVVLAAKADVSLQGEGSLAAEFAFDATRKRMTTVMRNERGVVAYTKGAPERVVARCTSRLVDGAQVPLDDAAREVALAQADALASEGLRVLAIADRVLSAEAAMHEADVEADLVLLGFVGLLDPPRDGVPEAIRSAHAAGVRTLMITGDAAGTALAIGRRVGLDAQRAVTGPELDAMDDEALAAVVGEPVVFARTTPEHKLRLVLALQSAGQVVAMTGDGVNDAPALKQADIGVAMGLRGTEVARSAADMILTDDNYASIVGAIEEGRRQYDNIQKFVRYLLTSNFGEVVALIANIALGWPLLLLPVQILWTNLITDGVTAVALGLEKVEPGAMERPPRSADAEILDREAVAWITGLGLLIGVLTVGLFSRHDDVDHARTLAFTGLVVLEKVNVFNFRALRAPVWRVGLLGNRWLVAAWLGMVGLQMAAVYVPFLQRGLRTVPLTLQDWGWIGLASVPVIVLPQAIQWVRARRRIRVGA